MLLHHARRASRTGRSGRLVPLAASPLVRLNREGRSARPVARKPAGSREPDPPRYAAVTAYLRERAGDLKQAATLYAEASWAATSVMVRDQLTREAARVRRLLHP
jgi:hypothetical protein